MYVCLFVGDKNRKDTIMSKMSVVMIIQIGSPIWIPKKIGVFV